MKDIIITIIDNLENNGLEVSDKQAQQYAEEFWEECKDLDLKHNEIEQQLQYFTVSLIDKLQEEQDED